jgi:mono/diheme cytochrome c family protein
LVSPAEQLSGQELRAVLDEELDRLSTKHRAPLILCFLEGQTRDEAAARLGWSLSTLKRRLERGRQLLAARLTRRGLSLGVTLVGAGLIQDEAWAVVSPTLMAATFRSAALTVSGTAVTGLISPTVAALSEGMVRAMMWTKLRVAGALVLALIFVGSGVRFWNAHQMQASAAPVQDKAPRAKERRGKDGDKGDQAALIKRGAYLANEVARCGDCHTPRDAKGKLDMSRHLQGAPIWFKPKVKTRGEWEDKAPDITSSGKAGKWGEARMVKFLSTGERSDAPMPAYRLSVDDARAMTAYLRSLAGNKNAGKKREKDDD